MIATVTVIHFPSNRAPYRRHQKKIQNKHNPLLFRWTLKASFHVQSPKPYFFAHNWSSLGSLPTRPGYFLRLKWAEEVHYTHPKPTLASKPSLSPDLLMLMRPPSFQSPRQEAWMRGHSWPRARHLQDPQWGTAAGMQERAPGGRWGGGWVSPSFVTHLITDDNLI